MSCLWDSCHRQRIAVRGIFSLCAARKAIVMLGESGNAAMLKPPNVLLVEVPPPFIALCETTGVSPQAALRGMAAMICGLRYDADDRLVPLEGEAA